MTRTMPPYICLATLICVCFGGSGCRSSLTIDVDVYTGPLVESHQTRISRSVGLAHSMRDVARRAAGQQYNRADQGLPAFYLPRTKDNKHSFPFPRRRGALDFNVLGAPNSDYVAIEPREPNQPDQPHQSLAKKVYLNKHASAAQLLGDLAQAYDDWKIDELYTEYLDKGGPRDLRFYWPPDLIDLHFKLLARLLSFSDAAAAIAEYLGLQEGAKGIFADDQLRAASLMLDESARILRVQLDSVHHAWNAIEIRLEEFYSGTKGRNTLSELSAMSEISAVMASQAPSTLLIAAQQTGGGKFVKGIFDKIYWKNINIVRVKGSGDVKVLVVKDEIGNWHLKRAVVDPTKVINAIQEVGTAAIKIAANAYGIPIPIGQNAAPDEGGTPASPKGEQADEGDKASDALDQLHDTLTEMGPTPTKEEVLKAISEAAAGL